MPVTRSACSFVGVTNPSSPGTIGDFSAATSGDPVATDAPAYTIVANASPGVLVTVNPTTTAAVATYTIANVRASGHLAGGSATIKLEAPSGTVFPNNSAFYSITDSTNSSGSGTVSAAVTGGGTNNVTFTVPNTINSGDVITLTVADVVNPSTASASDSITARRRVTAPPPSAATTTTTYAAHHDHHQGRRSRKRSNTRRSPTPPPRPTCPRHISSTWS